MAQTASWYTQELHANLTGFDTALSEIRTLLEPNDGRPRDFAQDLTEYLMLLDSRALELQNMVDGASHTVAAEAPTAPARRTVVADAPTAPPPRTVAPTAPAPRTAVAAEVERALRGGVREFLKAPPRAWAKPPMIVDRHTTVHQLNTPFQIQAGVDVIAVIHHAPSPAPVAVVLYHPVGQPQCTLHLVPVYDDERDADEDEDTAQAIAADTAAHNAALDACDRPLKSVRGADGRRHSGAQRRPHSVTH